MTWLNEPKENMEKDARCMSVCYIIICKEEDNSCPYFGSACPNKAHQK